MGERGGDELDVLVFFGFGDAVFEVLGEEDLHPLAEEAGAGEVLGEDGPALGADAGLFDHLAFGCGERAFVGLDAAGGEFEQELAGGVAVLADEDDGGVFGAGAELAILGCVDRQDDDGAVVADDIFFASFGVAGLDEGIGVDGEDMALVGQFGADQLGFSGFAGLAGERGLFFRGGDGALGGGGGLGAPGVEAFGFRRKLCGGIFGGRLLLDRGCHGATVPSALVLEHLHRDLYARHPTAHEQACVFGRVSAFFPGSEMGWMCSGEWMGLPDDDCSCRR